MSVGSAKKSNVIRVKLTVGAQSASLAPPVGPFLSQKGVDKKLVMEFCKIFNEATKDIPRGVPVPVFLQVYENGKLDVAIKPSTVSHLIKKATGLEKFAAMPGRDSPVATLSLEQCKSIAMEKMSDLSAHNIDQAISVIAGSARSMGIRVEGF